MSTRTERLRDLSARYNDVVWRIYHAAGVLKAAHRQHRQQITAWSEAAENHEAALYDVERIGVILDHLEPNERSETYEATLAMRGLDVSRFESARRVAYALLVKAIPAMAWKDGIPLVPGHPEPERLASLKTE